MKQWEYDYVTVKDEEYDQVLVKLDLAGKDGWEFTGVKEDLGTAVSYLMKRCYEDIAEAVEDPVLKTPNAWCEELGAIISDADGWRDGTRSWYDPITREEFDERLMRCTISMHGYPHFMKRGI